MLNEKVNVIDMEASGLSSCAYPIEVGVALSSGETYSSLIKPLPEWTYWDDEAESIHRISREQLLDEGSDIKTVCSDLNDLCSGLQLFSDCWVLDFAWMNSLFSRCRTFPSFTCSPMEMILEENSLLEYRKFKAMVAKLSRLPQHRAMNDALIIQNTLVFMQAYGKPLAHAKAGGSKDGVINGLMESVIQ